MVVAPNPPVAAGLKAEDAPKAPVCWPKAPAPNVLVAGVAAVEPNMPPGWEVAPKRPPVAAGCVVVPNAPNVGLGGWLPNILVVCACWPNVLVAGWPKPPDG